MTTLTIELTDEQAAQLRQDAQCLNVPVADLALRRLMSPWKPIDEERTESEFEAAMDYVFEKNTELYQRLA
jgi:hypothetical protein